MFRHTFNVVTPLCYQVTGYSMAEVFVKTKAHLGLYQISTMECSFSKIVNGYDYFRKKRYHRYAIGS